jgi:succinate dehydrogenase / fumarate reductase cytochrome b subunit
VVRGIAGRQREPRRSTSVARLVAFLATGIGRKMLMALTGLALIGFLVLHLAGNLLVFVGPASFNQYSHELISNPLIYLAEALLLLWFVAHLVTGIQITLQNRGARPTAYQITRRAGHTSHKSVASSTMIVSGLVLLLFVPVHLATFKFGPHYDAADLSGVRDLYRLVAEVFHKPGYVAFYIVALTVIGFHLWYGFESAFESLGLKYTSTLRRVGQLLALALAGGFILIPVVLYFLGDGS